MGAGPLLKMQLPISVAAVAVWYCVATADALSMQRVKWTAADPKRIGIGGLPHIVEASVYFTPTGATGPAVTFAHGFGISAESYDYIAEALTARGYVVAFPHNLGVVPSSLNLAIDQVFLLDAMRNASLTDQQAPFYGRVDQRAGTAILGHSLGGGTSILAADLTNTAAYPAPSAMVTLSLGTYTIPLATSAVPNVPATLPSLLMTATQDCIDPAAHNSQPVFEKLLSNCSSFLSVVGGTHCQYADANIGCTITEKLCGAHPTISRAQQFNVTSGLILEWLDHFINNRSSWAQVNQYIQTIASEGKVLVSGQRDSTCK